MEKNPAMILSRIHEILSGSSPLHVDYNKHLKLCDPHIATRNFERIFEFSLQELSQTSKFHTISGMVEELKSCLLDSEQASQAKKLKTLLRVIEDYKSTKSNISSIDDFTRNQVAKLNEYVQADEKYRRIWMLVEKSREDVKRYRSQLTDTKHKLDDLKGKWEQVEFQAGCSQSGLMANDFELHALEKEHDRLMKLNDNEANKYNKLFEMKSQTSDALKTMTTNSFIKLRKLKEIEKRMACQRLASIERYWESMRSSDPSQSLPSRGSDISTSYGRVFNFQKA